MPKDEEEANAHWEYIKELLEHHDVDAYLIECVGFHYKTAFVHGWKHGREELNVILTRTG